MPAQKIEAYPEADYRFGEGPCAVTRHVDQRSDALARVQASSGFACGLVVTALDPLIRARRTLSARVIEGASADPSRAWPEQRSLFALEVDFAAARHLHNRRTQDAVARVRSDAVPKPILLR